MNKRQLRAAIAVTLLIITAIWFLAKEKPLVEVYDLTVESFIDESHVVHDPKGFFN